MREGKQALREGGASAVNPENTSRTCPGCGHGDAQDRKTQATFACASCGFEDHANRRAARKI